MGQTTYCITLPPPLYESPPTMHGTDFDENKTKKTVQLLTCYLNIYIFSYIWSESKKGSKIKGEKNSLWIHLLDTSPVKCGCKERIVHRTKQLSAKDHRRKWGENTWPKTTKYIHEKNWGPLFFFPIAIRKWCEGGACDGQGANCGHESKCVAWLSHELFAKW